MNSRTNDCNVRIYERDFVEKFLTIVESSHPGKDFSVTFVESMLSTLSLDKLHRNT